MKHPRLVRLLPILIAVRDNVVDVLTDYHTSGFKNKVFDFSQRAELSRSDAENYYEFVEKTGLIRLFQNRRVKNFVDYVLGVEVGLDSNGRKNRGGTQMEDIINGLLGSMAKEYKQLDYLKGATTEAIKEKWGLEVKRDKSNRIFDFAVFNSKTKKLFVIETNFYNGGGSKLKATAGEYITLYNFLKKQSVPLVWITDGVGWETAQKPLLETFENNDYVFNLEIAGKGALAEVLLG